MQDHRNDVSDKGSAKLVSRVSGPWIDDSRNDKDDDESRLALEEDNTLWNIWHGEPLNGIFQQYLPNWERNDMVLGIDMLIVLHPC